MVGLGKVYKKYGKLPPQSPPFWSYFYKNEINRVSRQDKTLLKHLLNIILCESSYLNSFISILSVSYEIFKYLPKVFYKIRFSSNLTTKCNILLENTYDQPGGHRVQHLHGAGVVPQSGNRLAQLTSTFIYKKSVSLYFTSYCIFMKVVILFQKCISSLIILIVFYSYISYETLSAFQYNETLQNILLG